MAYETESVKYKAQFTDGIYKEVVAFANTNGGTILVGVDNDGRAVGLENVDRESTRLTNGIRDAIAPDVTMFTRFETHEDGVIRITVSEGANKPYYLKTKGLKPSGVYVRQGASSAPASPELIRRMIRDSDGGSFEELRSLDQALTFTAAAAAFQKYGVEFGEEKYRALGIVQPTGGLFSNLALILSDQCPQTTKVAVFSDDDNTAFKDSREFGGSIFRQLEDAFAYLMFCNRIAATINGLERVETADYPEEAIREALLNALVHRDYSFSGSIIINVNDHGMEFISIGGLLPGLSPDDIRSGISQPRNKNLAEVFHRLRLIESYGTGIRRIYHLYAGHAAQPQIEVTTNTFKIVLPNRNDATGVKPVLVLTAQMQRILDYITAHGKITEPEIEGLLNIRRTRAYTLARQMCDAGLIVSIGRGKEKRYQKR